jgi:hypothetical protein
MHKQHHRYRGEIVALQAAWKVDMDEPDKLALFEDRACGICGLHVCVPGCGDEPEPAKQERAPNLPIGCTWLALPDGSGHLTYRGDWAPLYYAALEYAEREAWQRYREEAGPATPAEPELREGWGRVVDVGDYGFNAAVTPEVYEHDASHGLCWPSEGYWYTQLPDQDKPGRRNSRLDAMLAVEASQSEPKLWVKITYIRKEP